MEKIKNIKSWLHQNNFSDRTKLNLLKKNNIKKYSFTREDLVEIAVSIKSDANKEKVIQKAKLIGLNKRHVCQIAKTFNSDNKKRKFISKMKEKGYTPSLLVNVIESFEKDKNKLEYIENGKKGGEYKSQRKRIIKSLKYEKSRFDILQKAKELNLTSDDMVSIISNFTYDSNKMAFLEQSKINELNFKRADIVKIIESIKSDQQKEKILNTKKIKQLGLRKSNISFILSTLKNDNLKRKYLANNDFKLAFMDQVKVVSSYNNDQLKLKVLDNINKETYPENDVSKLAANIKILSSLKDITKVEEYLNGVRDIPEVSRLVEKNKELLMMGIFKDREHLKKDELNKIRNICNVTQENKPPRLPKEMTIGVELEAVGKSPKGNRNGLLLRKMRNLMGGYLAKRDTSLVGYNGGEGVEVISPVMKNEDLETIPIITKLMKQNELTTNGTCGGHIHIGADYLDSLESWKNFFEIYKNCESIFYKISNSAGEKTRRGLEAYAKPFSKNFDIGKSVNLLNEDSLDSFVSKIKDSENQDRYYGLNLTNLNTLSKNTIEFRVFNGTLNDKTIYENIRLCTRLVEVARHLGDIEIAIKNKLPLSNGQKKLLEARNKLNSGYKNEEMLTENFLKMMFPNEEERKIYKERYRRAPESQVINNIEKETQKMPFRNISNKNKDDYLR